MSETGVCESCSINEYRDSIESFMCQSCPDNRITTGEATTVVTDCLIGMFV